MTCDEGYFKRTVAISRSVYTSTMALGPQAGGILAGLALVNAVIWILALTVLKDRAVLLGSAGFAYWLGWRHAFDADHIAAIDNVTRRLLARGRSAIGTGLFFSLGHSSVVFAVSVAIALTTYRFRGSLPSYRDALAPAATMASAAFLLVIGAMNLVTLVRILRRSRRAGERDLAPAGSLALVLSRLTSRIESARAMFPLGVLFGLGFDTATEIALLGIAATQAARDLPIWWIMIFPALFAAGMAFGDTLEGFFMQSMYSWTASCPHRRRSYNIGAVGISAAIAMTIAFAELIELAPNAAARQPSLESALSLLQRHSEWCGFGIVALFAIFWAASYVMERQRCQRTADPM